MTGRRRGEFLHVHDAARGFRRAIESYDQAEPVNLGTGIEISIHDLAVLIAELIGFRGELVWDTEQPNGQPRRRLDTERAFAEFGFRADVALREGLAQTITWYEDARQTVLPA